MGDAYLGSSACLKDPGLRGERREEEVKETAELWVEAPSWGLSAKSLPSHPTCQALPLL